jgi:transcriptional regulator with XRE-family HTH domain
MPIKRRVTNPRAETAVDVKIGEQIRSRRMLMSLSQAELGKKLGISFQQIQKYEKGTNRVSASRLAEIAGILKCPITDLMPAVSTSTNREADALMNLMQSRDGIALVQAFSGLPPRLRGAAVHVVEQMGSR